jgi:hypothetical protein
MLKIELSHPPFGAPDLANTGLTTGETLASRAAVKMGRLRTARDKQESWPNQPKWRMAME